MKSKDTGMPSADPALLAKIDKLFACGVGEHVALPQLVVVGDQSSGKSSVLEGLTKLPFPRDSGLCTRFATQITFKRHAEEKTSVFILPASNASPEHQAKLRAWSKTNIKNIRSGGFLEIMKEVQVLMGLGSQDESGSSGTFSEDVLRLELFGPEQQHLSIVDVPGIFRKTTEGVTTAQDREMVRSMVHGYMRNPRSVMLAVIPANVDIATQEILTMAEEVDPAGIRTLGVLTKPDLVDEGAEKPVIDLLNGTKHRLNLGWQVVRNPGQADLANPEASGTVRDRKEADLFSEGPWSSVSKQQRGIESLRFRLQDILTNHIRREFPKVQNEISQRLTASRRNLGDLGAKRGTTSEQRMYLTGVCTVFQKHVQDALNAQYTSREFDDYPSLRLPTYVVNRNEQFDSSMRCFGHLFAFNVSQEVKEEQDMEDGAGSLEGLLKAIMSTRDAREMPPSGDDLQVRQPTRHPELYDCTIPEATMVPKQAKPEILRWLHKQHTSQKGFEIGSVNPALLGTLFREQTVKWDNLTMGYISDVIEMVHSFITDLLRVAAPDENVRESIMAKLMDPLLEKYQRAMDHAKFLLEVEKETLPMTSNHYFSDNLQKTRFDRMRRVSSSVLPPGKAFEPANQLPKTMSNKDLEVQSLHDVLHSYYKVAIKRFVDNVCQQAVLYYLIKSPDSPLELFSASFVNGLSDIELEEIAGEDTLLRRKREWLEKEIADLEAGKKVLR